MANGYTVFFSYLLKPYSGNTIGNGYSQAIHCNYINKTVLDTISNREVNINFPNINDFKFLSAGGSGYTANEIWALVQLIDNESYESVDDVKPVAANWKMYEVTNQISGYTSPFILTSTNITSTIYSVPLYLYNQMQSYNLDYLDYPNKEIINKDILGFGEEDYFLGNVSTDIEAIAYSTDLAIYLPLNEFNSTSNATWDNQSKVYITEIAIYDNDKNLIGIGKLNDPIPKDATISRTIVFGMDF